MPGGWWLGWVVGCPGSAIAALPRRLGMTRGRAREMCPLVVTGHAGRTRGGKFTCRARDRVCCPHPPLGIALDIEPDQESLETQGVA